MTEHEFEIDKVEIGDFDLDAQWAIERNCPNYVVIKSFFIFIALT